MQQIARRMLALHPGSPMDKRTTQGGHVTRTFTPHRGVISALLIHRSERDCTCQATSERHDGIVVVVACSADATIESPTTGCGTGQLKAGAELGCTSVALECGQSRGCVPPASPFTQPEAPLNRCEMTRVHHPPPRATAGERLAHTVLRLHRAAVRCSLQPRTATTTFAASPWRACASSFVPSPPVWGRRASHKPR